ncbi:MAG TPA: UDP-N-acetylglucosamine 1-carboxyvinyltransferase [Phycisphaerae bacterium]|nr:UDP-N-acetylglucosamine 1-carboxyvinyltransferase [Phycisphaerae bacterium]HPS52335.1 UDP-N-acetylglucosamine 1-carboxyvinyltransferase [Phycisphaerae bacterium]
MDKFIIEGGTELSGNIEVGGAKNSALPMLAATMLCDGRSVLHDVPDLADIHAMVDLMAELGVSVERSGHSLQIEVTDESLSHAPYDRVRKMRASICVLGPLLAKRRSARVSMPGGCAIGTRPVDLHLRGMRELGAEIHLEGGDIIASTARLRGAEIFLGGAFGSTVLGTLNVMMAATLARGTTLIECAACEPEVADVADFLNKAGAKISGAGTPRIIISGVDSLNGVEHRIIPDRIEAGTFMLAGALCGRDVCVKNVRIDHLLALVDKLRNIGVALENSDGTVKVSRPDRIRPADVTTQPYPGFPTDLQAQLMVLLCLADGNSAITEKIFPDRFMHVPELMRMGADIRKEGPTAIVTGVPELIAAPVMASDLRASAALVMAGMVARGRSEVRRVYHIDRGYEKIETKLASIGAKITRGQE